MLWFDDQASRAPDDEGEERIAGHVGLEAFVAAVAAGAREALERYGEKGYDERWGEHPFPTGVLEALEGRDRPDSQSAFVRYVTLGLRAFSDTRSRGAL